MYRALPWPRWSPAVLKRLVHTLEVLFSAIGLLTDLTIFLLRRPLLTVFGGTLTENACRLSMQFMAVIAVTTVGTSYQVACDNGIIRGDEHGNKQYRSFCTREQMVVFLKRVKEM